MVVQGRYKTNRQGKYLVDSGKNVTRKKEVWKKKEEMQPMQRGNGSYRKA